MNHDVFGSLLEQEFRVDSQNSNCSYEEKSDGQLIVALNSSTQLLRFEIDENAWTNSDAQFLSLDVFYPALNNAMLVLHFFAHGESEARIRTRLTGFPGLWTRVTLPLKVLDGQKLFLPRTPGRLKGMCEGSRIERDEISYFAISLDDTGEPQTLHVANVVLLRDEPPYLLPQSPAVDEFGQWNAKDWPGKTADENALSEQLKRSLSASQNASWPATWSQFGGSREVQFEATGFFRCEYSNNRWWLVDPEGCAFWSAGMDCVRAHSETAIVPGNQTLLPALPRDEKFGAAWGQTHFGNKGSISTFDFCKANLIRAFGESWREDWETLTAGRLRSWRFNTIANWSDAEFARRAKIPYTVPWPRFPSTQVQLFRDFPDVFDPAYEVSAIECASWLEPLRNDPFLIGYFMDNEPHWAFGAHNIASEMLEQNPGTHSRKALAQWLSEKYQTSQELSQSWQWEFDGFGEIETKKFHRMAHRSENARHDLWEFSKILVRRCIEAACKAALEVDPNHLNLGVRYAWISSELCYEGGENFDVFSMNCYQMLPPSQDAEKVMQRVDRPLMVGEFHFGAIDVGLPASGLRRVTSQSERGVAYRRYVEAAANDANIVGVHYFQLNDQATLGRFDGENCNIGFVDCCHQTYEGIAQAAAQTHERLYAVRSGKEKPFAQEACERPKVF